MGENIHSDQNSRTNPIFTLRDQNSAQTEQNGTQNGFLPDLPRTLSKTLSISSNDSAEPLKCGYGRCTPKLLQYFHNAKCLLMCMCFCCITQGMLINGFVPVSITSVEKRFQLSSTQSGVYSSMYDIAVLIALIPVCHFGGKGHKGRWLGIGMFIMGIGSLICALPQFVTGPYEYGQSHNETCIVEEQSKNRSTLTTLEENEICLKSLKPNNVQNYFYVLLFGQLLNGFGAAPLYTLGITYIDENVSQKASPVYLGIYMAFSVVGPALGFVLGGMFLKIFGDVGKVDVKKVTINQNDPSWYGAWWMGMVLTSILSILFSIPLLGFARELPEAKQHRKKDIVQTNAKSLKSEPAFGTNISQLPKNCWVLLKNRTYSCLIVMKCAEAFLMNGMVTFIPKLVENLFSVSSSSASLITGAVVVPGGFLGNVIGGYIIKRFKLRCGAVILMACICQTMSLVLIFSMLIYCPEANFVGVNVPPSHDARSVALKQTCNLDCGCTNLYKPVCHEQTSLVYYSPCHAGCLDLAPHGGGGVTDKQIWTNCSCLNGTSSFNDSSQTVVQGLCDTGCKLLPVFLAVFGFQILVTFTSAMPIQQAELRCVPFKQRTLAVSLSWVFVRIFGAIPGAILFGIAIDSSCALWQVECGEQKACLRYASRKMALAIMSFGLSFKGAIIIFLLLAWKFYRPPPESEECEVKSIDRHSSKVAPAPDKITVVKL